MFGNVGRRGWLGALIGVCIAGALATAGASAAADVRHPQARVPWSQVGPGWTLAEYAGGAQATHATTLYLISPGGTKYTMYTWHASKTNPPGLIAWSGDKTRALLYGGGPGKLVQLNLTTGKLSRFTLAGQASAIGYTFPDGLNILGISESGRPWTLARYGLTGALTKVIIRGEFASTGVYSANGVSLAVPAAAGVTLVSNLGQVIRQLGVPGTNPANINKQSASGSITQVNVPGTPGTQNVIMTADGPRLLIAVQNSCAGGGSLLWFNPASHAEQWLLRGPAGAFLIAVPYNSAENAPRL
jgi:hypothetical protein